MTIAAINTFLAAWIAASLVATPPHFHVGGIGNEHFRNCHRHLRARAVGMGCYWHLKETAGSRLLAIVISLIALTVAALAAIVFHGEGRQ